MNKKEKMGKKIKKSSRLFNIIVFCLPTMSTTKKKTKVIFPRQEVERTAFFLQKKTIYKYIYCGGIFIFVVPRLLCTALALFFPFFF